MLTIDLRRACTVRVVEDIHADDVAPGSVEVRTIDGVVCGYGYTCPGCGEPDYLPLDSGAAGWAVTAGGAARPEGVSLSPSVLHRPCGWHGYLRAGRFEPC